MPFFGARIFDCDAHPLKRETESDADPGASAVTLQAYLDDLYDAPTMSKIVYIALSNGLRRLHKFEKAANGDPDPVDIVEYSKAKRARRAPSR